jgi:2-keto-4-pentenoate hydratase/2-oxohepta-3-ene-1,7-dioic acid hydratase in catechol pathway
MLRVPLLLVIFISCPLLATGEVVRYCRFQQGEHISYGIVEGEMVRSLKGDLFGEHESSGELIPLSKVKLLVPTDPTQVLALAGNYKSHLNDKNTVTTITTVTKVTTNGETLETNTESQTRVEVTKPGDVPEKFRLPQPFFKSPSCLIATGESILLPRDATSVHFEAELVIVIGKRAKGVPREQALQYVFGVTCGNDVSERVWQKEDVQWWRAKGSDTFGPVGPYIARGLNYDDLLLTLRVNGEEKQRERTSMFIQDVASTVSFISQHVTLNPGDLIFTGTPGRTSDLQRGDKVEVELEGVGVLTNRVESE